MDTSKWPKSNLSLPHVPPANHYPTRVCGDLGHVDTLQNEIHSLRACVCACAYAHAYINTHT